MRVRVPGHLQTRLGQREPVRLHRDGLFVAGELDDGVKRLSHALALGSRLDAHLHRVGGQRARPDAEHHSAPRHVVELEQVVSDHQRVVIGQRDDPGAELDVLGPLGQGGDEDHRVGDDLAGERVVLADPGFVVAEVVEVLDQLDIALKREGGMLANAVEGGEEEAEFHPLGSPGHGGVRSVGGGVLQRRG